MARFHSSSIIENPEAYARATSDRIKANSRKTNFGVWIEIGDHAAIVAFLEKNTRNEFFNKLNEHYNDYGKLSDGQVACVRRAIEKDAARKVERAANSVSTHVGVVGKRMQFELTINHIVAFRTHFSYYGEDAFVFICSDADGNIVVYKGATQFFFTETKSEVVNRYHMVENPGYDRATGKNADGTFGTPYIRQDTTETVEQVYSFEAVKGDKIVGKASVKAHDLREGIKQTIISRPAMVVVR